jgi:hypothetical protein
MSSMNINIAFEYAYIRLIISNYTLSNIQPNWIYSLWVNLLHTFESASIPCDVLMFGNDRSSLPLLFIGVAKLLNIPRYVLYI